MNSEENNLAIVRAFYTALGSGAGFAEIGKYYDEAVVQEEFPNAFLPTGAVRI